MDLSFTPEQEAFREEVRAWVKSAMPPHLAAKAEVDGNFSMPEIMEWHKILYQKGWVAPHWPEVSEAPAGTPPSGSSSPKSSRRRARRSSRPSAW